MKLNVLERSTVISLLPEKGDFATLNSIAEARENLSLSDEEVKEFDYTQTVVGDTTQMRWNAKGNVPKEIELGPVALKVIREKLQELDSKKELTVNHLAVFERFTK